MGMRTSRYEQEQKKKHRKAILMRVLLGLVLLAMAVGIFYGIRAVYRGIHGWVDSVMNDPLLESSTLSPDNIPARTTTAVQTPQERYREELAQAEALALSYDYDGAIALLQGIKGYGETDYLKQVAQDYLYLRNTMKRVDISTVYHLYLRPLIADPAQGFGRTAENRDDNQRERLTVSEFQAILQQLYDNGFVLVDPHQIASLESDGSFVSQSILLPEGKKPLVLTLENYTYSADSATNGIVSRLILDAMEKPLCELKSSSGSSRVGDFDVIPLVESFVALHPDFSYRGARGVIALTGYEGIFGYRTASIYADPLNRAYDPKINPEQERQEAAAVCNRLKELGWSFASQTYGYINVEQADMDRIKADMQRWMSEVAPLTGPCDILYFPPGTDIGNWRSYGEDNEKFVFYREQGFHYFSSVDTYTIPWVQFNGEAKYLRLGRVGLGGYALVKRQEKLAVFFDSLSVLDPLRPLPVPEY